jgi:hypothetical protein
MQAIQKFEISKNYKKFLAETNSYQEFKKVKTLLLAEQQLELKRKGTLKKKIISKIPQSLENNSKLIAIIDSNNFEVDFQKTDKKSFLEIILTFKFN